MLLTSNMLTEFITFETFTKCHFHFTLYMLLPAHPCGLVRCLWMDGTCPCCQLFVLTLVLDTLALVVEHEHRHVCVSQALVEVVHRRVQEHHNRRLAHLVHNCWVVEPNNYHVVVLVEPYPNQQHIEQLKPICWRRIQRKNTKFIRLITSNQ